MYLQECDAAVQIGEGLEVLLWYPESATKGPVRRCGMDRGRTPKYPVRKVSGRKKIVASVSCFMLSFWYAAMVLKIRLMSPSAWALIEFRDSWISTQWSSTSPRYVYVIGVIMTPFELSCR